MLKLMEQNELIEQDGTQNDQLGALQTFDRDLTSPLEYVLEQTIERLNCLMAQHMENTTDIGAGITTEQKSGYPNGPVQEEGSVPRLLRTYPNLYADISAMSGYNALTRDEPFGIRFLNEFQDKLLFGTDICFADEEGQLGHLGLLRGLVGAGELSQEAFDKIASANALGLLKRYDK